MMRNLIFCLVLITTQATAAASNQSQDSSAAAVTSGKCSVLAGKTQICWGNAPLERNSKYPWSASFAFTFAKPFAGTPTITNGILVDGAGHTLAVHAFKLDRKGYSGALNNASAKAAIEGKISMHYVAIGNVP